ncbi:MAG TPA: hypothetical protein PK156_01565 [Polyangium sp.]|nr:hypothetical protein [Polyangium sp.]
MFRALLRPAMRLVFALVSLVILLVSWRAEADPAKRIYVGIYLRDVTRFDQKNGAFDADVELWAKWMGEFDKDKLVLTNAAAVEQTFLEKERCIDERSRRNDCVQSRHEARTRVDINHILHSICSCNSSYAQCNMAESWR